MDTVPKVTVLIPTKNGGAIFAKVLEHVVAQHTPWPFEVLVIDSGSSDNTIDICRRYPEVRLHTIPSNEFGHGRTRNLGVSMARSEFVALITQDALPLNEHWLAAMVAAIEPDPAIAGVFGRHIAYPDANPFTTHELELHFAGFDAWQVVQMDDPERYTRDQGYRQVLHFFSDNNAVIRRSVWEKLPYPDVDFAEDQIWAQKIIEAGYKKAYARDAVVVHSHNYELFERLQRSFDEAYAFRRLFGYVLCPSPWALVSSWAALTRRDLAYARRSRLLGTQTKAVLMAPFDNFMRLAGHYLGARGDRLPGRLRQRLSRDKRLMLGLGAAGGKAEK
ncbi:glycosyltransferase family 2 protein [Cupriavidus pauculus]|uniref:glycosyltransferase family 2 protein n=1 Tax=Cupriavidus pauculus TaxID=82633 RepID=UPI001246EA09|nr:glycosyltransferase family A protein [Cupriavidus pauculus]KAB0601486.1 glycosyltransferase family 2 protein [Cupriavidus pauculus]UAL01305.1 glycosyltransferase family 2 protein [Cupriavidus pauculus]